MYDWDEQNLAHIAKHGVSAKEAEEVIENDSLDLEVQIVRGEERLPSLGETNAGRILLVISCWLDESQRVRVVTAYEPAGSLRQKYLAWKGQRYGGEAENT